MKDGRLITRDVKIFLYMTRHLTYNCRNIIYRQHDLPNECTFCIFPLQTHLVPNPKVTPLLTSGAAFFSDDPSASPKPHILCPSFIGVISFPLGGGNWLESLCVEFCVPRRIGVDEVTLSRPGTKGENRVRFFGERDDVFRISEGDEVGDGFRAE